MSESDKGIPTDVNFSQYQCLSQMFWRSVSFPLPGIS